MEGTGVRFCGYGAGLLTTDVEGGGMGMGWVLVSGTFHCPAPFASLSGCTLMGKWHCMSPWMAAILAMSIWVDVDEERLEFSGRRWSTNE